MNIWGQVITLRGQILVSSTGVDPPVCGFKKRLRVSRLLSSRLVSSRLVLSLFLCLLYLSLSVSLCPCLRVSLWSWCVRAVWCVTLKTSVCTFKTSPCMQAPRAHAFQHVRVLPAIHGDVLNVHTEVFSVTHHTARTHHDHHDTRRQGQRETERQIKKTEKERRDETRRDERRREGKRR